MEIASIFSAEPERQCRTCGEELPATFFPETGAQYHSCKSEYERQWRAGKEQRQPPAEQARSSGSRRPRRSAHGASSCCRPPIIWRRRAIQAGSAATAEPASEKETKSHMRSEGRCLCRRWQCHPPRSAQSAAKRNRGAPFVKQPASGTAGSGSASIAIELTKPAEGRLQLLPGAATVTPTLADRCTRALGVMLFTAQSCCSCPSTQRQI